MIVKIEVYFEVTPTHKGVDIPLDLLRKFLKRVLSLNRKEYIFHEDTKDEIRVSSLTEEEAFEKLSTSLRVKK
jgi:hypothetical protein